MALDDSPADRQTDSGARILAAQSLEQPKDVLEPVPIDPDAVVTNGEQPLTCLGRGRDVGLDRSVGSKLQSIREQVLEDLAQLGRDRRSRSGAPRA